MATTAMDYENENGDRFEEDHRYDRDRERSASPRVRDDHDGSRRRSGSPNLNPDHISKDEESSKDQDEGAINPGSNLFVTGIHPSLNELEVTRLFEKYGEVEKCQIMRDPHSKESRGFGFVKMVTPEQADAAREGLQGEVIEGRTLGIEKARRSKPRTPTPGKYYGPPKRDVEVRPRFNERFDDRRRGGYSGGASYGREDPYRYRGYERRYEERRQDDRLSYADRSYERHDREPRTGDDRSYDRPAYRDDRAYNRDEQYGRSERYQNSGGRNDRDRYGGARGGGSASSGYDRERYDRPSEREGNRPREPVSAPGHADSAIRSEGREPYGGSRY